MQFSNDTEIENNIYTLNDIKPSYPPPVPKTNFARRTCLSISTSDRATKHVLAPYVRIKRKGQPSFKSEEKEDDNIHFEYYLKKKPTLLIRNLSLFLSDSIQLSSILHESVDVLKCVCKAAGATLYLADSCAGIIYINPQYVTNERYGVKWKIEPEHTIAAYVAYQKEYVMVDDVLGDMRFPEGVGFKDETIKSVLCVPIVSQDDNCSAVVELYRDVTQSSFTQDELKLVVVVTGWIGAAIHQNQQRLIYQKKQELNDYLFNITKCYYGNAASEDSVITEIINFAKSSMSAERASFYMLVQNSNELEAKVYEYGIDDFGLDKLLKKKLNTKLNQEANIVGIVAHTAETINIVNAYKDSRFIKELDEKYSVITRSILCVPVKGVDGLIGVIQIVNKINDAGFNSTDEAILNTIASYCSTVVEFSRIKEEFHKTKSANKCYLEMLKYHMKPCYHDKANFNRYEVSTFPENFNEFYWAAPTELMHAIPQLTLHMFCTVFGDEINVNETTEFILAVQKGYRDNPYHCFGHAFHVCHCMYNIIQRNMAVFDPIELKAFMVAALCHDLDHRGLTNNFLQLVNHPLVELYEESYLENHHYHVTLILLREYNIYNIDDTSVFQKFCKEIQHMILATDLAAHFKVRTKFAQMRYDHSFDWNNVAHRDIIKGLMMTSSDLSGQCKPYSAAKKITDLLYKEFYSQGDIEKEMGLCPLAMMDRDKQQFVLEEQVQFLSVVVIPCTELLELVFSNTDELRKGSKKLREIWKEMIELRGQKLWRSDEAVVANDY
ncbi:hypothetical protein RI129_001175 [Pyrocoelia pectoralis]|uniref:Phosphodiesterase n=1 Tax=Pyrocoelia pectoralis TaxID=417401 RepID=A0AAN7VU72_9COLE